MSNLEKVEEFMNGVGQAVSRKPTKISSQDAILRVRLILEEALELAAAAGVKIRFVTDLFSEQDVSDILDFSFEEDAGTEQDLVEIADALADLEYVIHGASLTWGIPAQKCFDLVHESNMSKLEDGYKDENGKWIKGPKYKPVDLSFINDLANP